GPRSNRRHNRTHGESASLIYGIWKRMRLRCTSPIHRQYCYYGGRGITVCDEWLKSYEAFRDYMGPRPSPTHSIERIDNSAGYKPGNVRWATQEEQLRNRRNTLMINYHGRCRTATEWSRELQVNAKTLQRWYHAGLFP